MLQTFHMVDDFYFSIEEVHAVSGVRKRQSKASQVSNVHHNVTATGKARRILLSRT